MYDRWTVAGQASETALSIHKKARYVSTKQQPKHWSQTASFAYSELNKDISKNPNKDYGKRNSNFIILSGVIKVPSDFKASNITYFRIFLESLMDFLMRMYLILNRKEFWKLQESKNLKSQDVNI